MPASPLRIEALVPGGILATDHVHRITTDHTCSRCRRELGEEEKRLMLWIGDDAEDMLIYCEACLGIEPESDAGDLN